MHKGRSRYRLKVALIMRLRERLHDRVGCNLVEVVSRLVHLRAKHATNERARLSAALHTLDHPTILFEDFEHAIVIHFSCFFELRRDRTISEIVEIHALERLVIAIGIRWMDQK